AIELVGAGLIEFDTLITHRVKFQDYTKAYEIIDQAKDKAMKVMIEME
ncbi:MAG: theronine dehydrogenase-like Zn-dependent dehydrogenase, partial [Clostridiales bacterium]|nr:theronine dehydrogenase-like Zn-dependent dehydrogenase [Clostridiales bacterium]